MEGMVLMPVRWEHAAEVRALIQRLESKDDASMKGVKDVESRTELVRRVYESCSEATQRMLLYLAERPGQWILGVDLALEAARLGTNNVSSQMRSVYSQAAKYELSSLPFEYRQGPNRRFSFMMPHEDAEIVRGFVS